MNNSKHQFIPNLMIDLDNISFECKLDDHHNPVITHDSKKYKNLFSLIEDFPELKKATNMKLLVQAANFLFQGVSYHLIEDINIFKEAYLNRIEYEKNSLDYMPVRLIDHGIFDVSIMHPPQIIGDELIFFVQDDRSGIPYRVTCLYPITQASKGTYHLLPYM